MNRTNILGMGAGMRNSMLAAYNAFGNEDAARIARRYVFEIAKVMAEVHGDADAASLLYQTADTVAAKLPLEDYRLLLTSPATGGGCRKTARRTAARATARTGDMAQPRRPALEGSHQFVFAGVLRRLLDGVE